MWIRFLDLLSEVVVIFSDERSETPKRLALHLYRCAGFLLRMMHDHNWCCIIAHLVGILFMILICGWGSYWFVGLRLLIGWWHVRLTERFSIDTAFNSLILFTFPRVAFRLLDLKNFGLHLLLFCFHILQVFSMIIFWNRLRENTV